MKWRNVATWPCMPIILCTPFATDLVVQQKWWTNPVGKFVTLWMFQRLLNQTRGSILVPPNQDMSNEKRWPTDNKHYIDIVGVAWLCTPIMKSNPYCNNNQMCKQYKQGLLKWPRRTLIFLLILAPPLVRRSSDTTTYLDLYFRVYCRQFVHLFGEEIISIS